MDENLSSREEQPGTDEVLAALDNLLGSPDLHLSERNRRFLSFVVTQAVNGSAERIKAYTIGVDVFGRDEAFDPGTDPIVRIEATRLRAALASYYERAGADAPVKISLPKGSYMPAFAWAANPCEKAGEHALAGAVGVPSVRVQLILQDRTPRGSEAMAARAELFLDTLAVMLGRAAAFTVKVVPPGERKAAADAIQAIFSAPQEAFSLDIAVRAVDEMMRYSWRLGDLGTGEILAASFRDYVIARASSYERIDDLAADATGAVASAIGLSRRPGQAL